MPETALILGATGRFGRHAAKTFAAAGWRTRLMVRRNLTGDDVIFGDPLDPGALIAAADGADVIVSALNPAYPDWPRDVPRITSSVIAAAKETGATVLIPGNVYNYGAALPEVLSAETPQIGDHRKAAIRIVMERAYAEAGVTTIILRAGDFIDDEPGENWFEGQITAKLRSGRAVYPGPMDRQHAWAFLPDLARAAELLARKRAALPDFADIGFPGYTLTGAELLDLVEAAADRPLKRGGLPWPAIRLIGLINPLMREVAEMRYLWKRPHRIDAAEFERRLPDFRHTPPAAAIRASLAGCGRLEDAAFAEGLASQPT
ncbi:MAG: NAD(P)H-binding protein [Pseudomonadota bacterium]